MSHAVEDRPELGEQFDDPEQQRETASLGMWVFLATEVMFFGGAFTAYTVYRNLFLEGFIAASRELKPVLGGINTAVLLTSSFSMAMAVRAMQLRKKRELLTLLSITMILGATFLGIKMYEWYVDYREHLVPGPNFQFEAEHFRTAQIFFLLYFIMTGLHGLHMIIGLCLVGTITYFCWKRQPLGRSENQVEIAGLYWHFVDLVWVFLYPLLYLIDVHK